MRGYVKARAASGSVDVAAVRWRRLGSYQ